MRTIKLLVAVAAVLSPVSASAQMLPPHQPGTICYTQYGWCWMPGVFPLNARCFCNSPQGPIPGIVV